MQASKVFGPSSQAVSSNDSSVPRSRVRYCEGCFILWFYTGASLHRRGSAECSYFIGKFSIGYCPARQNFVLRRNEEVPKYFPQIIWINLWMTRGSDLQAFDFSQLSHGDPNQGSRGVGCLKNRRPRSLPVLRCWQLMGVPEAFRFEEGVIGQIR